MGRRVNRITHLVLGASGFRSSWSRRFLPLLVDNGVITVKLYIYCGCLLSNFGYFLLLCMFQRYQSVLCLPFFVGELTFSLGEELFVEVGCLLHVMKFVVRRSRQKCRRRRRWQNSSTHIERAQGALRIIVG